MRSPNYPAHGLEETIQMARTIWNKEERTAVSKEVAAKALGCESMSGTARAKLSSLRKFGLLDEDENGNVKISSLAMRLLHHQTDSQEYRESIKEAALKPEIYKELYGSHSRASDDAIRSFLKLNKAFSESGAGQCLEAFRATLDLANLNGEAYTPVVNGYKPGKTPVVGDVVQWESNGVLQFLSPRRVRALSEDGEWAFVDGSKTGLPIEALTVVTGTPPESQKVKPPVAPTLPEDQVHQDLQDVFAFSDGRVVLSWPSVLSKEDFEDISAWLDIAKRKIKRAVKTGRGE